MNTQKNVNCDSRGIIQSVLDKQCRHKMHINFMTDNSIENYLCLYQFIEFKLIILEIYVYVLKNSCLFHKKSYNYDENFKML